MRFRLGRSRRRLLIDLAPLRDHRDFRLLMTGEMVSVLGTQLTVVAVMFQVYDITGSSLYVGLVSLAQMFPMIFASLIGGSVVDAVDRRRVLLVVNALMALSSVGLALNSDWGPTLWPLFIFPACTATLAGFDGPARNAIMVQLLPTEKLAAGNAMFQALTQLGSIVGPAAGGLLLAGFGVKLVYWIDVLSFVACLAVILPMSRQPPGEHATRPGLRSIVDGLKFVWKRQTLQGVYLIDINAMVFGMPRALFPSLAAHTFGGSASALGFLYAAPGAGALVGAMASGWVSGIRRRGRAVTIAVIVWGAAIAAFGLVAWLPAALLLLAIAGWADVISAVLRNVIIQSSAPGHLQGRLSSLQMAVVTSGPRLGDLEAGGVATAFTNQISVVSGGLACIVGALVVARLLPGFRHDGEEPAPP